MKREAGEEEGKREREDEGNCGIFLLFLRNMMPASKVRSGGDVEL